MDRVYLAGPIFGCDDGQAMDWREMVKLTIGESSCIDPMRHDYREREAESVRKIVVQDRLDIEDSKVVLANCWQVSWGTAMEVHYAYQVGRPVIAVVRPDVKTISPWLRYHSTLIVRTLKEGIIAAHEILNPQEAESQPRS